MRTPNERILVVGGDDAVRERYVAELRGAGYRAESRAGVLEDAEGADLVLVAGGAPNSRRDGVGAVVDAVTAARKASNRAAVLACVPREAGADAIEASMESGADDVVVAPPVAGALLARVRAGLRIAQLRVACERYEEYGDTIVHIGAQGEISLESPEALHDVLQRIAEAVGWTRAALVLVGDEPSSLLLVAASDDQAPMKIPLAAAKYPEIRACLETREPVLVDDTASSSLLGEWAPLAAEKGGKALLAVPLVVDRRACGCVLLRHEKVHPPLPARGIDFLRMAAMTLGLILRAGRVFEGLREQTNRMSLARYNEERRTRALDQYKDFFESASDGMVVVDATGRVLYLNRAAQQITGWAQEGLTGRVFSEMVAEQQRQALDAVIKQVADEAANLESFDLQMATTSGEPITVSVASSSVLSEHGAAILAFRDVTERRALEGELRKARDFLERLIDSTVDGIVAADMRGQVMIFNQGAARLYGFSPEEVISKMPVWKLYPDGVARAIMSELRAEDHGGVGRLEPTRRDIVTKEGELVPVTLAASIIYEDHREVATVGIISDLRERLKIEQRLVQAQEKLLVTEKQALIAELAGTTAHELNQPLTSVMGYSELLKKKLSPDDSNYRAVDIILREAERMAEIVRKIGRITRYETKAYVGSTKMIDLDKSAEPPPEPATREGEGHEHG